MAEGKKPVSSSLSGLGSSDDVEARDAGTGADTAGAGAGRTTGSGVGRRKEPLATHGAAGEYKKWGSLASF
jgi:hypothetical protein